MKIGIACYPTYGGSGVVATELGLALAERDGGFAAILLRVVQGEITVPEERQVRAGSVSDRLIPPELSAIAMKALSKHKADRYQTVDAFRRDIALCLEGRSVSARQ